MHIAELRRRTTVFQDGHLKSRCIEWTIGDVVTVYRNELGKWSFKGGVGYRLVGFIHPYDKLLPELDSSSLPTEFFNHQLFECDPTSEESVMSFVTTWGFPFIPLRNMPSSNTAWRYQDEKRIVDAIQATHELRELALTLGGKYLSDLDDFESDPSEDELELYEEDYLSHRNWPKYGDYIPTGNDASFFKNLYSPSNKGIQDAISFAEAALTLEMLQESIRALMNSVRTGAKVHMRHLDTINMGSANPYLLLISSDGVTSYSSAETERQQYSLLTAAICNQILDSFRDTAPWRACACKGCTTIFKRKQGLANTPSSDSVYCCKACEERQKKRNQRMAAKNRILHW